jgi:hypothetical protein
MATVVLSPCNVVNCPDLGGHFWVYMQYAQGLRRLGCDVYWLECFRSEDGPESDAAALRAFGERMDRYGLGGKLLLYRNPGEAGADGDREYVGVTRAEAEAIFRRADLLLNFDYRLDAALLARFRRTALVDIDPGLLQFWISTGQLRVHPHDVYFTIGETVGTARAHFPDCGLPWVHIRPAVCLDLWPYVKQPPGEAFTTVSSWCGYEWITDGKDLYYENNKRISFLAFAELPHWRPQVLELALFLSGEAVDVADRQFMERQGWRIRYATEVARTPELYQAYVQGSRGEFGCAKPAYGKFQTAWVSDRTLCYLASGRPAVVQNTGPSSFLPNGEGLFRFATLEEAAAGLAAVDADYQRHRRAAREIAEAYFDAEQVCERILNVALRGSLSAGTADKCSPHGLIQRGRQEWNTRWTTDLMRETLQEGLARLRGRPVRVHELHREPPPTTTSFWTERLQARLDGDEGLLVFFKDLNPESLIAAARQIHATGLDSGRRELHMYRRILSRQRFGTPELYAWRWEPSRGLLGLFLEHAGPLKLRHSKDFTLWLAAARWAARFHSAARAGARSPNHVPAPQRRTRFLPRYDRAHYRHCAERIEQRLAGLAAPDRPVLEHALEVYTDLVGELSALPQSIIHGEYFGKNIVVRDGSPDEVIAVVDWESAAVGPSYLDLVSLSTGRWTPDKKEALWRAYFDRYRADTGLPLDWARFCRDIGLVQLYQALAWIGWWLQRGAEEQVARWLNELQKAVPERPASLS